MRLVFAGTPEFAATALQALHAAGFDIALVLTQPDRPAGRGMKLHASPVKQWALSQGLPVAQPRSLRLDGKYPDDARAAQAALIEARADAMIVAAYGLILPPWVLEVPPRGCLNIHASLLPRWRGAAPIHRAIEAGDAETGITIMQMDAGLDTGPMLMAESEPITPEDTTARLHDRLAAMGGRLIVQALRALAAGDGDTPGLRPQPQPAEGITYAHKIEKSEARLDWCWPAARIERRVRAFDPFPGLSFERAGEPVKVWRAAVAEAPSQGVDPAGVAPGTVLPAPPGCCLVACGDGTALELLELQKPGGRRMPVLAFQHSDPMIPGDRLA